MKPEKTNKLIGILLRDVSGKLFLRTTEANGSFRDYQIHHSDLSIAVVDDDAAFVYRKNGGWIIDHSPATLGISKVTGKPIRSRKKK